MIEKWMWIAEGVKVTTLLTAWFALGLSWLASFVVTGIVAILLLVAFAVVRWFEKRKPGK